MQPIQSQDIEDTPKMLHQKYIRPSKPHQNNEAPILYGLLLMILLLVFLDYTLLINDAPQPPSSNEHNSSKLWPDLSLQTLNTSSPKPLQLTIQQTHQPATTSLLPPQLKQQPFKTLSLEPVYIWIGRDLPDKYKLKLNNLKFTYKYRLIRNCDRLLNDMETLLRQKFHKTVYQNFKIKTNLCRLVYLYYNAGLYLDLDTKVELPCLNSYLRDKRIFFELSTSNTIDSSAIYSAQPQDPELLQTIKSYNTHSSLSKQIDPYCDMIERISNSIKTVQKSGCVTHKSRGVCNRGASN